MVKKRTCIFISGKGTNLKNLISRSRDINFPITINLIICNKKNARGIFYAKKFKIPYKFINTNTNDYERKILFYLKKNKIAFICLAGYLKIISDKIINEFKNKIINVHPSLLPKFKGLNTFARIIKNKEVKTGCTVHYVNNKLDDGKIIVKKSFFINSTDDENTLKEKTQVLEYKAYPEAIINIFRNY